MNILKKNIVLIIVICITLLASGVLFFLIYQKYNKMRVSLGKVEELKKEISDLNKTKPAPVKENEERISEDIEKLQQRLRDIRKIFGKTYRIPLQHMASELGLTEDELLTKWKKYWQEEKKKQINKYTILSKFFKNFDQQKLKNALRIFRNDLLRQTAEPILDISFKDIVMAALNVPRNMSPVNCKTFISNMQTAFLKKLKDAEIGVTDNVADFTFTNYLGTSMPRKDDITMIIRHWLLLDHLVSLITRSKLSHFNSISKDDLYGRIENGFLKLRYTVNISGSLNAVRDFINSMQEAYRENRVYIIKDISLEKATDAVESLGNESEKAKVRRKNRFPGMPPGEMIPPEATRRKGKKGTTEEQNVSPESAEDYGKPLIGMSNTVKAKITFDYVIYIGDELQE